MVSNCIENWQVYVVNNNQEAFRTSVVIFLSNGDVNGNSLRTNFRDVRLLDITSVILQMLYIIIYTMVYPKYIRY